MDLYIPALGDENVLSPLPSKSDVYRSALTLRPEIEAGRLNVKASELDINIARSGYIPTVSLSAGIGSTNTNGNDFTFGEQIKQNWNNSLGVTVSVPIFNNRQTKSAVQKAKIQNSPANWICWTTRKPCIKPSKDCGWMPAAHSSVTLPP